MICLIKFSFEVPKAYLSPYIHLVFISSPKHKKISAYLLNFMLLFGKFYGRKK